MLKRILKSKLIILSLVVVVSGIATLGMIPYRTCACGEVEDGTQLTRMINAVWVNVTGERYFPMPPNPAK